MSIISVRDLLEAGVHFGHRVSRWNPKMAPYIFGKKNLVHIINLRETVKGLIKAFHFLKRICADGEEVIFVGTKRQAKSVIKREAQRCMMHYVSERWLGGTLTNFETIRKRLVRLDELEKLEETGTIETLSKKFASSIKRERKKIERNLEGIKKMEKLPKAVILIDTKKEYIALKEASRLGIPTICLIDTDSDPDLVDIAIPGNEDAMRSIEVIISKLADAVSEGRAAWDEKQKSEKKLRDEANTALTPAVFKKIDDEEWEAGRHRAKKAAPVAGTTPVDRKVKKDGHVRDGKRNFSSRQRDFRKPREFKEFADREGGKPEKGKDFVEKPEANTPKPPTTTTPSES